MSVQRVSLLWELSRPTGVVMPIALIIFLIIYYSTMSSWVYEPLLPSAGGRYGVYYPGVPWGLSSTNDAWLYDLQQDADNRSNLALVNTGEDGDGSDTFRIDLFDGSNGQKVHTIDGITVGAHQWTQIRKHPGPIRPPHHPGLRPRDKDQWIEPFPHLCGD